MIDWNKPIQTRDGRPAKLIATLNNNAFPRVVVITYPEGTELCRACKDDGTSAGLGDPPVVNVPEEFLSEPVYVNVYECDLPCLHASIDFAARSIARESRYLRTERWVFSTTRGWLKENEQTL